MASQQTTASKRSVATPSGRIGYTEVGAGPVSLFVHGVLLNGHLWRHQLAELSLYLIYKSFRHGSQKKRAKYPQVFRR